MSELYKKTARVRESESDLLFAREKREFVGNALCVTCLTGNGNATAETTGQQA